MNPALLPTKQRGFVILIIWMLFSVAPPLHSAANEGRRKVKQLRQALAKFAKEAVPPKAVPKPESFKAPAVWGEAAAKPMSRIVVAFSLDDDFHTLAQYRNN